MRICYVARFVIWFRSLIVDKHVDDSWKAIPTDSAYPVKYYRWRTFTLVEAIQAHRETHDPTMYDVPNAPLNILIEMNMQGEKKTRFVANFSKLAKIEYPFDHGEERQVLAFAKDDVSTIWVTRRNWKQIEIS